MAMASASKRAIIAMALLIIGGCHQLMAQGDADSVSLRPSFGLDYTSELQTDFSRAKWNNLLQLRAAATVAAATSVLGFRTHIPQGLQNALVGVVTVHRSLNAFDVSCSPLEFSGMKLIFTPWIWSTLTPKIKPFFSN